MSNDITFQVETERVLGILAKEIYDSPLALLRENVQNAYDAIRMRFVPEGRPLSEGKIDVRIVGDEVLVADNGIGMSESVLTENFWKAGSSGKRSEAARSAGVVGTFGIGAMANFGVCSMLTVCTRAAAASFTLVSSAERQKLKIAEKCISLDKINDERPIGTTITAKIDPKYRITPEQARQYLGPYIRFLTVPVYLNDQLMSCQSIESNLAKSGRSFSASETVVEKADSNVSARFGLRIDQNGQLLVKVDQIRLSNSPIEGQMLLLQDGGQLYGLRSDFGLAPIPVASLYQFGGFANLPFLQPTAGREAVSRESIDQVSSLVALSERVVSEFLGDQPSSDKNSAFMHWIMLHNRHDLAKHITIRMQPNDVDLALGWLKWEIGGKIAHYYTGTDRSIIELYSGQGACLLLLSQTNPRRTIQLRCIQQVGISQVPDAPRVMRSYTAKEMDYKEAAILVRVATTLREDYLIPGVDVLLSDISHGVTVLPLQDGEHLRVHIAKQKAFIDPLIQVYNDDYRFFASFIKDFVRNQVYPRIQQFVPSSTRQGVDALRKILERNRELYRYEEAEAGELESLLRDLLPTKPIAEVLNRAQAAMRPHTQRVTLAQVGSVEGVVPEVGAIQAAAPAPGEELAARPPILRDEIDTNLKVLLADRKHPLLNKFSVFLGLSDRLMREFGEFFRAPHTTRTIWAGHRVIYIFSDVTSRLSLYYDVELKEPLPEGVAGGRLFPTTTIVTKRRTFVPVPEELAGAFKVTSGAREFYVRFDLLGTGE